MPTTREIILRYYDGWVESDRECVRSLLADDLHFKSPDDEFDDADSFLAQCWKLADGFREMNVAHSIFAEDGGYLVYTFGDFSIGELVKVRDGRITEIYVTYNSTY
jgi:ketosteroid isomerase-like protein